MLRDRVSLIAYRWKISKQGYKCRILLDCRSYHDGVSESVYKSFRLYNLCFGSLDSLVVRVADRFV